MIIVKKLGQPILSLIHLRLMISSPMRVKKETKIIVKTFDQVAKMTKPSLLASTLLKSNNTIINPRNNRILVISNAIIVKRFVFLPTNVPNQSQKTSFSLCNLDFNNSGRYESCFTMVLYYKFLVSTTNFPPFLCMARIYHLI